MKIKFGYEYEIIGIDLARKNQDCASYITWCEKDQKYYRYVVRADGFETKKEIENIFKKEVRNVE